MSAEITPTATQLLEEAFFLNWLQQQGYFNLKPLTARPGWWGGCFQFMFTHAIIAGRMGDTTGYSDRWCYHDRASAVTALEAWDGQGEPTGWHRHPGSGRRIDRETGEEYISP